MSEEDFETQADEVLGTGHTAAKHNEAPASMNMKAWIDGYGFLFTIRTGATQQEVTDLVDKATKLVALAKVGNWQPSWETPTTPKTPSVAAPEPLGEVPSCPIHNVPMKLREGKFGPFYSCGTKLQDGSWCKQNHTAL